MKTSPTWKNVAAALVVAGAASVAGTPAMATDYNVGAGQTYTTLNALYGSHSTFGTDKITFTDSSFTDNSLANPFNIADGTTLTLSGTATISRASGSAVIFRRV